MFKLIKSAVRLSAAVTAKANRPAVVQQLAPALYSTFLPREFQFETSDGECGTLIHRLSRHIALAKRDYSDPTRYNFRYSEFYPVYSPDRFLEQLGNISTHDLGKLICMTSDIRGKSDYRLFADVMNALDDESESRVDGASFGELVGMLHGFMYLIPNKITKLKTYKKAIPRLVELFGKNVNEKDFMSVLFFLGLWKKSVAGSRLMDQFLQDYLVEFLKEEMTLMDFVLLANASYKTSVRIKDDRFRQLLVEKIGSFEGDDMALLVTLVKCARMNRIRSDRILEKLRKVVEDTPASLDFRGLSHLFAYVGDNQVKDDALIQLFLEEGSRHIEQALAKKPEELDYLAQDFRAKDLATFLWSCSTLSIPLTDVPVDPKDLTNLIHRKIDDGEYRFIPDTLVDTCLSLWLMDYPSVDLMSSIFSDRQFAQNFKKDRVKIESRRDLLLACAEIERPEAFKIISKLPRVNSFQLDRPAPDFLVKNRAALQRAKECLDGLGEKLQIREVEFNLPIKFLNIAGLLVELADGSAVNVDVLERGYCLSDEQTATGLMALKSRLLNKKGVESVMINSLMTKSDEEWTQALEDIVQNVRASKTSIKSAKAG